MHAGETSPTTASAGHLPHWFSRCLVSPSYLAYLCLCLATSVVLLCWNFYRLTLPAYSHHPVESALEVCLASAFAIEVILQIFAQGLAGFWQASSANRLDLALIVLMMASAIVAADHLTSLRSSAIYEFDVLLLIIRLVAVLSRISRYGSRLRTGLLAREASLENVYEIGPLD